LKTSVAPHVIDYARSVSVIYCIALGLVYVLDGKIAALHSAARDETPLALPVIPMP
jgi:hypothetical protein